MAIDRDVSNMTDAELRSKLEYLGRSVGPLTEDTRHVYELQLLKLLKEDENETKLSPEQVKLYNLAFYLIF